MAEGIDLETAIDHIQDMESSEKHDIKEWLRQARAISILVTGKTGAGKSSLLNYILGANIFSIGKSKSDPHTTSVSSKTVVKNGVTITAWDSPGLQDGTTREIEYLRSMKAKCSDADLVLYCISMEETRTDLHHHNAAIAKITRELGTNIWKHTLFVLTFANMMVDALEDKCSGNLTVEFDVKVQQWKESIQSALRKLDVPEATIRAIQVVPAGHPRILHLPRIKHWISHLWAHCLLSMKELAQPALIQMESEGGFVNENDVDEVKLAKAKADERKIIFTPTVKTAIGLSGAGLGAAVGATIGATIGALAIGIPSFGIAAGAGLGIGAASGAAIGCGIAALVGVAVAFYRRQKQKKKKN